MMNIVTVFENEDFLVLDKPHGVLSVPGRMGKDDVRPCLSEHLKEINAIKILPVHRLDYEVRGLILFAKNAKAHTTANTWFEKRLIKKQYKALSSGDAPEDADKNKIHHWEMKILRGKKRAYIHEIAGKPAITEARFIGTRRLNEENFLAWEITPLTGRSHQIRFSLAHHGFPIVGDSLYGGKPVNFLKENEIALNAISLDLSQINPSLRFGLPEALSLKASWDQIF